MGIFNTVLIFSKHQGPMTRNTRIFHSLTHGSQQSLDQKKVLIRKLGDGFICYLCKLRFFCRQASIHILYISCENLEEKEEDEKSISKNKNLNSNRYLEIINREQK
jgi:hypothetical protein